jgi:hypothetical protein
VRPWIDHLRFSIVKAVGIKKTHGFFYFLDKESLNAFNTFFIKHPLRHHAFPGMPMDNDRAPWRAVSSKFILLSLI